MIPANSGEPPATGLTAVRSDGTASESSAFTLKDWRLWVASFGFFWSLFVCGVISMYGFKRTGAGSELMTEEILTLPLIQDTIFAIIAPFVFVISARRPIRKSNRIRDGFLYLGGGIVFAVVHVIIRLIS